MCNLRFAVHIGKDGELQFTANFGQDLQTFFHARTTKGRSTGAVSFVVARLENELDTQCRGNFFQSTRGIHLELFRLHHTRARDQKKRML